MERSCHEIHFTAPNGRIEARRVHPDGKVEVRIGWPKADATINWKGDWKTTATITDRTPEEVAVTLEREVRSAGFPLRTPPVAVPIAGTDLAWVAARSRDDVEWAIFHGATLRGWVTEPGTYAWEGMTGRYGAFAPVDRYVAGRNRGYYDTLAEAAHAVINAPRDVLRLRIEGPHGEVSARVLGFEGASKQFVDFRTLHDGVQGHGRVENLDGELIAHVNANGEVASDMAALARQGVSA